MWDNLKFIFKLNVIKNYALKILAITTESLCVWDKKGTYYTWVWEKAL